MFVNDVLTVPSVIFPEENLSCDPKRSSVSYETPWLKEDKKRTLNYYLSGEGRTSSCRGYSVHEEGHSSLVRKLVLLDGVPEVGEESFRFSFLVRCRRRGCLTHSLSGGLVGGVPPLPSLGVPPGLLPLV